MGRLVFALNEGTFREIREGVISFAKQSVLWVWLVFKKTTLATKDHNLAFFIFVEMGIILNLH